jgi:hypothetical protein
VQVGRRKPELLTAFSAVLNTTFDPVRTSQHPSRKINLTPREQLTNPAGTHAPATQANFGYLARDKAQLTANTAEQFDVSFTVMAKGESLTEINFLRVQTLLDYIKQKLAGGNFRKLFREANDDCLLYAKHAKPLDLLVKSLEQRWRRRRMQHGARMWIECDHCWDSADRACPFNDRAHDQLVAEVQSIEDTEG